ncbi:MAG: hypothetical protein Q9167_003048 [Letrouitia subvulpina]
MATGAILYSVLVQLFKRPPVRSLLRRLPLKALQVSRPEALKGTSSPKAGGKPQKLLSRLEVEEAFKAQSWQRQGFDFFATLLTSKDRVYPCVYAAKGFKAQEHVYTFLSSPDPSAPANVKQIAAALLDYLPRSRQLGPNTSLVIIAPPEAQTLPDTEYNLQFWSLLKALTALDPQTWPENIPQETDTEGWCFCFAGEPCFMAVLTPAHQNRRSRHAPTVCIAIQPKWIFDILFSTPQKREGALKKVRSLVEDFDDIPLSPDLGNYGEKGKLETRQYFLLDRNESSVCPFRNLKA